MEMDDSAACSSLGWAERKARAERRKQEYEGGPFLGKCDLTTLKPFNIVDAILVPGGVDMESFNGSENQLSNDIEKHFANTYRHFHPNQIHSLPPVLYDYFAKDWALNAQGIYYDECGSGHLSDTELIWVPSLQISGGDSPEALDQRRRASNLARRARQNETCVKSEYAWEADAWADVFPRMRDDTYLAMDKREYKAFISDTDKCYSYLTGTSSMVCRTPDVTVGLATFLDRDARDLIWTSDLHRDRLERLMLHPNYGLISDPNITSTWLAFPFMVYEAKGWKGDCRDARRQACSAAAAYLDLLDNLARRPGPTNAPRPYQTTTSNKFQVFALTSFGAHWHLLVGHRRPRLPAEYAGSPQMSETVYMFQRLWSGRVTSERNARQLLSLIDQIHDWAITDFRSFVLEHLQPWHQLCDDDYLLEWDSLYPVTAHRKRRRAENYSGELRLPSWVAGMPDAVRRHLQDRAKASFNTAATDATIVKGKYKFRKENDSPITCRPASCGRQFYSEVEYLHHAQTSHNENDRNLAQLRWLFYVEKMKERILENNEIERFEVLAPIFETSSDDEYIINPPKCRKKNR